MQSCAKAARDILPPAPNNSEKSMELHRNLKPWPQFAKPFRMLLAHRPVLCLSMCRGRYGRLRQSQSNCQKNDR